MVYSGQMGFGMKNYAQQPFVAIAWLGLFSEFSPKIPQGVLYL